MKGGLSLKAQAWAAEILSLPLSAVEFQQITPDMGERTYFRLQHDKQSWVICAYPRPLLPEEPFFLVYQFLRSCRIPLPQVLGVDMNAGWVLQEDLGTQALSTLPPEKYLGPALDLIIQIGKLNIQNLPLEHPIRSRALNSALYIKEMGFTTRSLLAHSLKMSSEEQQVFLKGMERLLPAVDKYPWVLCHRDYHLNNIFFHGGNCCIIDFQDMRMGFGGYDVYSLLFERETALGMKEELFRQRLRWVKEYWEEGPYGKSLTWDEFFNMFLVLGIQRALKAMGNFSNNPQVYKKYIPGSLKALQLLHQHADQVEPTLRKQLHFLHSLHLVERGCEVFS